jgi:hypothetical protein
MLHQYIGRAGVICGIVNLFLGLQRYEFLYSGSGPENCAIALSAWLVVIAAAYLACVENCSHPGFHWSFGGFRL